MEVAECEIPPSPQRQQGRGGKNGGIIDSHLLLAPSLEAQQMSQAWIKPILPLFFISGRSKKGKPVQL